MNGFFTGLYLKKLARHSNNDLLLIMEIGPGPFETRDLKKALLEIKHREEAVAETRQRIYLIGACSAVFLFFSYIARALGADQLGLILLLFFPVLVLVFSVGQIYLRRRYPAYVHYHVIRDAIRQELDFRRKESSIF